MPKIIFVVAYAENQTIGINNQLPWHLPNDFKHFKQLTLGHKILMGRKTYESIGRPLPNRTMIVLTRNTDFKSDYAKVVHSLNEILPLQEDLYVIGGAEIFNMLLAHADIIQATIVKADIKGDAFFPKLDPKEWHEVARESHPIDEKHTFAYDFVRYQRII